jgi:hypothetical protein
MVAEMDFAARGKFSARIQKELIRLNQRLPSADFKFSDVMSGEGF